MSADNWAICPRCLATARAKHDGEVTAVMATYGKVPVEEFDAARAAIEDVDPDAFRTFREDYEFYGASEGEVQVWYRGQCSECGIGTEFRDERRFYFEDEEEQVRLAALRTPALSEEDQRA